jgi:hypothetical protein
LNCIDIGRGVGECGRGNGGGLEVEDKVLDMEIVVIAIITTQMEMIIFHPQTSIKANCRLKWKLFPYTFGELKEN